MRYDEVDVVTGDTGAIPFGIGSFASRVNSIPLNPARISDLVHNQP